MAVDSYMNLQLENTEEYINEEFAGNLGTYLYMFICMHMCIHHILRMI
jgi:small nuclear ribonucleoprotein (snRNP)-like protein